MSETTDICFHGKRRYILTYSAEDYLEAISSQSKTVVAASAYCNPCHVGHLRMFEEAKRLGDFLIVIINNDNQVKLKGSVPFMSEADRVEIVAAFACVDAVVLSIDEDRSVCKTLEMIRPNIFVNGGDVQDASQCREAETCQRLGIQMIFGVGGYDKIRSSSELIRAAVLPT